MINAAEAKALIKDGHSVMRDTIEKMIRKTANDKGNYICITGKERNLTFHLVKNDLHYWESLGFTTKVQPVLIVGKSGLSKDGRHTSHIYISWD